MLVRPALLRAREDDLGAGPVYFAREREPQPQPLRAVHEVRAGREADDDVRTHFGEGPGFDGGEGGEGVVLGVVEDFVVVCGIGKRRRCER